jgi:hypothetical protein
MSNDTLRRALAAKVDLYRNSKEEALYPLMKYMFHSLPPALVIALNR